MGDNGRRARAWPRKEGQCSACARWYVLLKNGRCPSHLCKMGIRVKSTVPNMVTDDNGNATLKEPK